MDASLLLYIVNSVIQLCFENLDKLSTRILKEVCMYICHSTLVKIGAFVWKISFSIPFFFPKERQFEPLTQCLQVSLLKCWRRRKKGPRMLLLSLLTSPVARALPPRVPRRYRQCHCWGKEARTPSRTTKDGLYSTWKEVFKELYLFFRLSLQSKYLHLVL